MPGFGAETEEDGSSFGLFLHLFAFWVAGGGGGEGSAVLELACKLSLRRRV